MNIEEVSWFLNQPIDKIKSLPEALLESLLACKSFIEVHLLGYEVQKELK